MSVIFTSPGDGRDVEAVGDVLALRDDAVVWRWSAIRAALLRAMGLPLPSRRRVIVIYRSVHRTYRRILPYIIHHAESSRACEIYVRI